MGGYGALLHGLQNPARYSAIGAFSPGIPNPEILPDPQRVLRTDLFRLTDSVLRENTQLPGYEHEFSIWDIEVPAFLEWIHRGGFLRKVWRKQSLIFSLRHILQGKLCQSFRHLTFIHLSTLVKLWLRNRKCFLRKVFSSEESKGENDDEQL